MALYVDPNIKIAIASVCLMSVPLIVIQYRNDCKNKNNDWLIVCIAGLLFALLAIIAYAKSNGGLFN